MKVSIRIEYFEMSDHWSWEVTVNSGSAYGAEGDHGNAFAAAEFALEDMMQELGAEVRGMNFKGKTCQLCGPVTGKPRASVERAFGDAERALLQAGAETVWNPVERVPSSATHETAMAKCLRVLVSGTIDALVVLPDFEGSDGAMLETAVAEAVGIPVVDLEGERA